MRTLRITITTAVLAGLALSLSASSASASAGFALQEFSGAVERRDGSAETQAAAHPHQVVSTIKYSRHPDTFGFGTPVPDGDVKTLSIDLPPGFLGNPNAVPKCDESQLQDTEANLACPASTQIGLATHEVSFWTTYYSQIYNMVPPPGVTAQFAMNMFGVVVHINARLRQDGTYGASVDVRGIPQALGVSGTRTVLWGVPADPAHDGLRGRCVSAFLISGEKCKSDAPVKAFLTNPADCSAGPLTTKLFATAWEAPDVVHSASFDHDVNGEPLAVDGCEKAPFEPSFALEPDTRSASSPTGPEIELSMPQAGLENPSGLGSAALKRAEVILPEGMAVNPSSASGLGACSMAELGISPAGVANGEPVRCPDSSKIGELTVKTPLLEEELGGSVYLATQGTNPFNSLLALYLVVDDAERGILVKLAGKVSPDPATGQLRAVFDANPQLPFSSLGLRFKGGSRAPLITPPACGTYTTTAILSPWSAADPNNPTGVEQVVSHSSFVIASGPGGSACPPPAQFDPAFEAGTVTPLAGAYSPLVVRASRPDGSQVLKGIDVDLPEGLVGKLAGVPYCPEAALAAAAGKSGTQELAAPSCATASKVGTVDVGAGAGSTPFHTQGTVYLAGPYKGAPLSLAVITPAVAGPFDLGTVVVRAALEIDPMTAEVKVKSDPIPTILQGIPLQVRSVEVSADRPSFTLNPTSCDPSSIGASLSGASASRLLSSRFQVGGCAGLGFKPKLSIRLKGSTKRGGHPALTAVVAPRPGDANIGRAVVALPKSEFLAQDHIRTICTRVQFAADQCPTGSVYGTATAATPLLDEPLRGTVYLRSSSNPLPDMVVALRGQIDVDLVGRIDSDGNGGIRTTFASTPDAPVSKFTIRMRGGRKSLLENSTNLCASVNRATVEMIGQNGKAFDSRPVVKSAGCGKARKGKGSGKARGGKR